MCELQYGGRRDIYVFGIEQGIKIGINKQEADGVIFIFS